MKKKTPAKTGAFLRFWLPFVDAYRTMCLAPEPALKRLLEGVRDLRLAA